MITASVDAVITDPPYPEIDRDYGRMSESEWQDMMRSVVHQCRRVLKPSGSAMFVLQPNSEKVGQMRPWLWDFLAWAARYWNQVQDVYWWNYVMPPTAHCQRKYGLMRPSMKLCVWLGDPECYRDQDAVLWEESDHAKAQTQAARAGRFKAPRGVGPSGHSRDKLRVGEAAVERGGVTPFNVIPMCNSDPKSRIHGATTPRDLAEWWARYITKPGDTVLDPFSGTGTIPRVAAELGREAIGIEKMLKYHEIAKWRLS